MPQLLGNIIEICKQAFYTQTEIDSQLEEKSDINHTHEYVTSEELVGQMDLKLKNIFTDKVANITLENNELKITYYEEGDL